MVKINVNVNALVTMGVVGVLGYFGWKKIKSWEEEARAKEAEFKAYKEVQMAKLDFEADSDSIYMMDEVHIDNTVILDKEHRALIAAIKAATTKETLNLAIDEYKEFMDRITKHGAAGAYVVAAECEAKENEEKEQKKREEEAKLRKEVRDADAKKLAKILNTVKDVSRNISISKEPKAPLSNESAIKSLSDKLNNIETILTTKGE